MSTGFDFAERRVVDAPNMAAEALTKPAPPNVEPGTELTYFMRITDGGTSNTWFKLDDFSFGASAETSWVKGSGASVGKPLPEAFELTLGSGVAQSAFTMGLLQGTQLDRVEIEAYAGDPARSGGSGIQFQQRFCHGCKDQRRRRW
jgi:hypothetical protein